MELNFIELRTIVFNLVKNLNLSQLLSEDMLQRDEYDGRVILSSESDWDSLSALVKLLPELLKYRPLPF